MSDFSNYPVCLELPYILPENKKDSMLMNNFYSQAKHKGKYIKKHKGKIHHVKHDNRKKK